MVPVEMRYLFKSIFNGPENYNSAVVVWGVRKLKRCPVVGVARFGGYGFRIENAPLEVFSNASVERSRSSIVSHQGLFTVQNRGLDNYQ